MSELLDVLKGYQAQHQNPIGPVIDLIEETLLQREKDAILTAYFDGCLDGCQHKVNHEYFNQSFTHENQSNT